MSSQLYNSAREVIELAAEAEFYKNCAQCPICEVAYRKTSLRKHTGSMLCLHVAQTTRCSLAGYTVRFANQHNDYGIGPNSEEYRTLFSYGVEEVIRYGKAARKPVQKFWVPRHVLSMLHAAGFFNEEVICAEYMQRVRKGLDAMTDFHRGVLASLIELDPKWPTFAGARQEAPAWVSFCLGLMGGDSSRHVGEGPYYP